MMKSNQSLVPLLVGFICVVGVVAWLVVDPIRDVVPAHFLLNQYAKYIPEEFELKTGVSGMTRIYYDLPDADPPQPFIRDVVGHLRALGWSKVRRSPVDPERTGSDEVGWIERVYEDQVCTTWAQFWSKNTEAMRLEFTRCVSRTGELTSSSQANLYHYTPEAVLLGLREYELYKSEGVGQWKDVNAESP